MLRKWIFLLLLAATSACLSAHADIISRVEHYWDGLDPTDTIAAQDSEAMDSLFTDFLTLLTCRSDLSWGDSCVTASLHRVEHNGWLLRYWLDKYREKWLTKGSPLYNERRYLPVAQYAATSVYVDEGHRERARFHLRQILLNRVGSAASDFSVKLTSGQSIRLFQLRADYTILLFYDPDCPHCLTVLDEMYHSLALSKWLSLGVKLLAVYPYIDEAAWRGCAHLMRPSWLNGINLDGRVADIPLYDLSDMPRLYLLDRDKSVVLRNTSFDAILSTLRHLLGTE